MKLADGREIQEVKYFDGIKWNSRIVRLFRVDKWLTIMKSENFKEDFIYSHNMQLLKNTGLIQSNKLLFDNIVTYKVWSGDEPIWDDTPVENSALEFTSLLGYQGVSTEPVDGYYLLNAGSYGGIFISTMQFEIGKSYKISFDYITTNNPGHVVITDSDVTRGTVYYGTNTSLNLVQDGQANTKEIIIEATETKGHALGLMRSSNSGEVKIKADSIKVIEI